MTPNTHRKIDIPISEMNDGNVMFSQQMNDKKEPHAELHTPKRKSAKCPFFANPIKLGLCLGFGIYALIQGAQQVLLNSSGGRVSSSNQSNKGLWNLPTAMLGGPNYNALAIMEASKHEFTNRDIGGPQSKQAERSVNDARNDGSSLPNKTSARATSPKPWEGAVPTKEKVSAHLSTASITKVSSRAEAVLADNRKDEPPIQPAKLLVSKDEIKTIKPRSKKAVDIPTTKNATAARRKEERPIESKSPVATRKDWQKVMREQPLYPSIPSSPLKVGLVTANGVKGPTQHVFVDGIYGSDYLTLEVLCDAIQNNCTSAMDYPKVQLWMVDANSAKSKPFPEDIVHQIVAIDNPSFRIFFVDYSDRLVLRKGFIDSIYFDIEEERLLAPHIRYALRCIDKYRRWAKAKGYINPGRIVHPMWDEMLITKGGPPLHAPFGVRTDIADAIHNLLPSMAQGPKKSTGTSCSPLPYHPVDCIPDRPMDLIHLWKVIETNNGLLRNLATESVEKMRTWQHPTENRTLRVETAIQGSRAHAGRQSVSDDYVRTLLQTKIVVVTQRDGWEDHFRLFEALAAGALVLMDEMVSLPHGLEDGESVVFFHSIEEMHDKAMYYLEHTEERLAIASKGWEVTMEKHRSWHRLEEMLFGKALTKPNLRESWHFDS